MEWSLDIALIVMLAATLFHALRLERALGVLKQDRAALESLVQGFNESTRLAEQGIDRLRQTADGAGRQIARQIDLATALKDDLVFLGELGEALAERLDGLVRAARTATADAPRNVAALRGNAPSVAVDFNRNEPLQSARSRLPDFDIAPRGMTDRGSPERAMERAMAERANSERALTEPVPAERTLSERGLVDLLPRLGLQEPEKGPRLRSQAERDLLKALKMAR